jgi:glucose/arabinose dehydrogenase
MSRWTRHAPSAPAGALACLLVLLALAGCGSSGSPTRTDGSPAGAAAKAPTTAALVSIGAGLRGPAGLKATLYAQGPPTVASLAFDPEGRLWMAAAGLEGHTHDGVYVVAHPGAATSASADTNIRTSTGTSVDGSTGTTSARGAHVATAVKVVSGLENPLGLAWLHNRLYVASVGRVDAYGGFAGVRFATHTTILHGPAAGAENNLLVLAPDGRFTMGVTATCDHCAPSSPFSGAVVSFEPDGSGLRVYASRIRAPFGLAYFPGTSDLFATMNQRDDLGAATPGDWLALVKEGQDWGFPGCYGQGGAVCAGVPAPVAVLDPHAAVGGVVILTGQLGAGVGTAAIVAEWQSAKVLRVALRKNGPSSGSTYTGAVAPFLTGMGNPLAVALAPDGALLVGDWATGRIYRIAAPAA